MRPCVSSLLGGLNRLNHRFDIRHQTDRDLEEFGPHDRYPFTTMSRSNVVAAYVPVDTYLTRT